MLVVTGGGSALWFPGTRGDEPCPSCEFFEQLEVTTEGSCLNFRAVPGIDEYVIGCVDAGFRFVSDGRHADRDGEQWVHVWSADLDRRGWVAEQFLRSADLDSGYRCGP